MRAEDGFNSTINNQKINNLSRSLSSSGKTRTADTSTCNGFPATLTSNSDNTAPGRLTFLPPHAGSRQRTFPVDLSPFYAARSLAAGAVHFQQSAISSQA